jgi:hypothetical protein
MTSQEKERLINRICSGCIILKGYLFSYPSPKIRYKADNVYLNSLNGNFSDNDAVFLLRKNGKWTDLLEKEMNSIAPNAIEQLKIEIYQSYEGNRANLDNLKDKLRRVKENLFNIVSIKHSFDEFTTEWAAERERLAYILKKCVKPKCNPEDLFSSFDENKISDEQYRELARSYEWSTKWSAFKRGCRVFSKNFTIEQEILIKWSSLYESVYEQQDCPKDEIISDDDAFDGWMIWKKQENDRARGIDKLENRIKNKHAQEVYLPVNVDHNGFQIEPVFEAKPEHWEEAKKISALNSPEAARIKNQRLKQVEEQGIVPEFEVKDGLLTSRFQDNNLKLLLARNNVSGK